MFRQAYYEMKKISSKVFFFIIIGFFFLSSSLNNFVLKKINLQNEFRHKYFDESEVERDLIREQNYVRKYRVELNSSIGNLLESTHNPLIKNNGILRGSLINQAKAYESLQAQDLNLKYQKNMGIDFIKYTHNLDLIILISISLMAFLTINIDRQYGTNKLINTIRNGSKNRARSKLIVCYFSTLIFVLFAYGSLILYAHLTEGFGDMSRNIQSLIIFRDASLNLTIGKYILIFIFQKLLTAFFYTSIVIFLMSIFKNMRLQVIAITIFLLLSFISFRFIGKYSIFDFIKYSSIFSLFDVYDIYGRYSDVYLFAGFLQRYIYSLVIEFTLIFALNSLSYSILLRENEKYINNWSFLKRSRVAKYLFEAEAYRLFFSSFALFSLVLCIISSVKYVPKKGIENYDYLRTMYIYSLKEFEGRVDEGLLKRLEKKKQYYDDIGNQKEKVLEDFKAGKIKYTTRDVKLEQLNKEEEKVIGFEKVRNQVLSSYKAVDEAPDLYLQDEEIGEFYFGKNYYVLICSLIFYLTLILILSETLIRDESGRMNYIIKSTKMGHYRVLTYRKINYYIYSYILFIIGVGYILVAGRCLGYKLIWHSLVQSHPVLLNFGIRLTCLGLFILQAMFAFVNTYMLVNFIILINQILKNRLEIYACLILACLTSNLVLIFFPQWKILSLNPFGNIFSIFLSFSRYGFYGYLINLGIMTGLAILLSKCNKKLWTKKI